MPRNLKDLSTTKTIALPNGASGSVTTADIDLGSTQGNGGTDFPEETEVLITVPALTTTMLPDTRTLTIQLQNGAAATPTTAFLDAIVIAGAGGVGYAGGTFRRRVQSNALRYLNAKFTTGASTTDMSTLSGELALVY